MHIFFYSVTFFIYFILEYDYYYDTRTEILYNPCSPNLTNSTVRIYISLENDKKKLGATCAGVLLSKKWVLTAASCTYAQIPSAQILYAVLAGNAEGFAEKVGPVIDMASQFGFYSEPNRTQPKQETDFLVSSVKRVVVHPNFDPMRLIADVALFELHSEIPELAKLGIRHADLKHGRNPGHVLLCKQPQVIGWGRLKRNDEDILIDVEDNKARCKNVTFVEFSKCFIFEEYRKLNIFKGNHTFLQTIVEEPGDDGCVGDTGGPLICDDGVFMGVVSGLVSPSCQRPKSCTFYTSIEVYFDFIRTHTKLKKIPGIGEWQDQRFLLP